MSDRLSIIDYGLKVAEAIALRSPDPYRKVGAIILNADDRIISTGYNGLMSGFTPPATFWKDKQARKPFMIHAEINALSYITKGEGKTLICTLKPCEHCLIACIAHGIKTIWYNEYKEGLENSDAIAKMYGISFNYLKNF